MLVSGQPYEPTACVPTTPFFACVLNPHHRQNANAHVARSATIPQLGDGCVSLQGYPVETKPVRVDGPNATQRYRESRVGGSISGLSLRIHCANITAT